MEDHNSKGTPDIPEKVVSPPEEGQDIPENKSDDRKEGEENEKTERNGKSSTLSQVKDKSKEGKNDNENDNDKNKNPNKRGRGVSSPNKEPSLQPEPSPPRKRGRGRKPKLPTKNPTVPTLPTFRTTRNLNAIKYVNRVTRKQIPNDIHKRNRVCIDCKKTEVEECLLCGKEQHICDMGVDMKIQADYEWLWVCLDCLDIATDDIAMKNVRELVDKEKKKKQTKTYTCNICTCVINSNLQGSIQCTQCSDWGHRKCAGFKTHAEAVTHKSTYKCNKCKKNYEENERLKKQQEIMDMSKTVLGYNGINISKNDIETTKEGRWFNDTIMSCGLQELQSEYRCEEANILLIDPTVTQLIKNYHRKDLIKTVVEDIGIKDSEWTLFIVSNHNNDLMDTAKLGTGGSHFSLLVYNKKQNTFFDFDPILLMNGESVNKLYKNLKGFLAEDSKLKRTICSQQKNGYDCGPYTLLFAEKLIHKIIKGEDVSTTSIQVEMDEVKRCRLNLQNMIRDRIKSQGEGNKDSNNHKDKDGMDDTSRRTGKAGKDGHNRQSPTPGNEGDARKRKTIGDNNKINGNIGDKRSDKSSGNGSTSNNNMGKGNNLPCWYHNYRICKFGKRCTKIHKPVCEKYKDYGDCRDLNCKLLHQKLCRQYFSLGYCTNDKCWYTHPLKRWQSDPISPSNRLPQGNNRHRNNTYGYQNEYIYDQGSYSYGDNSYNNQNYHHTHRNSGGGSRNRQNRQQDYTYGMQWDNMGQPNFLGNQQAPIDMGRVVTDLMGAVKRMNTSIERLERGQINRWTQ